MSPGFSRATTSLLHSAEPSRLGRLVDRRVTTAMDDEQKSSLGARRDHDRRLR
jgi:hypothetical protein